MAHQMGRTCVVGLAFACAVGAACLPALGAAGPTLPRRGALGVGTQTDEGGGALVSSVRPGSAAEAAGLRPDDVVQMFNGAAIKTSADLVERVRVTPGGTPLKLVVDREGDELVLQGTMGEVAKESVEGCTVTYGAVQHPGGYLLRTILTEPKASPLAKAGRHPAFFFMQGMPCQSLDRPQMPDAPDTKLVHAMARAGFITLRVDKPGTGDSQGPPCDTINFDTELAGYRAALSMLRSLPSVDPDRVYIFGHSLGGVMAPYLMAPQGGTAPVRGAIVYGTGVRTWLEYQLENVRRQTELFGVSPAEVTRIVQEQSLLAAGVLLEKKTIGQVWEKHPELRPEDDGASQLMSETTWSGRHVSLFHQLQDLNLPKAWLDAQGSVLAVHGQYDWVSSLPDHETIAELVAGRKAAPGQPAPRGESFTLPRADHAFTTHDSLSASLQGMGQGKFADELPKKVQAWIAGLEAASKPGS